MATAVIWTEANHWTELMPGESMDGRFMAVANIIRQHMENASSWNDFFENNLKLAMAKWPEVKDWEGKIKCAYLRLHKTFYSTKNKVRGLCVGGDMVILFFSTKN